VKAASPGSRGLRCYPNGSGDGEGVHKRPRPTTDASLPESSDEHTLGQLCSRKPSARSIISPPVDGADFEVMGSQALPWQPDVANCAKVLCCRAPAPQGVHVVTGVVRDRMSKPNFYVGALGRQPETCLTPLLARLEVTSGLTRTAGVQGR
jgi:hypothetical protein